MSSSIKGELVTETFDYDGGRQVTAYVPARPPEAIVFAGDGQLVSSWAGDLKTADVPATMVVGVHQGLTRRGAPVARVLTGFRSGAVRGARDAPRRGRTTVDADAVRSGPARGAHGRIWRLGGRESSRSLWDAPSRYLRRGFLRVAGRRLPAACRCRPASARILRRRHAGASSRTRPGGPRRCGRRRGGGYDRAGRVARRCLLGREFPLMVAWAFGR